MIFRVKRKGDRKWLIGLAWSVEYLYLQCHRSKNEGLGCPHYRKCGFFMPLFFPVYIFVLIIRLIIAINTESCN